MPVSEFSKSSSSGSPGPHLQDEAPEQIIGRTRAACAERLAADGLRGVGEALSARAVDPAACVRLLSTVDEAPASVSAIQSLRAEVASRGMPVAEAQVELSLLLGAALTTLPRVARMRVSPRVQELLCAELRFLASAAPADVQKCEVGTARFVRMAKMTTGRRWPAGQFEWEVGGIGRRDVFGVDLARLPGTVAFLLRRMHGLAPVFFSHLNPRRTHRSLLESEANRSYFQMARAMELQPEILGFAACSWFRSPGTHQVSPHLAWLSRVFLEHGGWVVDAGFEDPECGVLYRGETRRKLYDAGQFKPRRGLVLWPRREMIGWAAAHPELATSDDSVPAGITRAGPHGYDNC